MGNGIGSAVLNNFGRKINLKEEPYDRRSI